MQSGPPLKPGPGNELVFAPESVNYGTLGRYAALVAEAQQFAPVVEDSIARGERYVRRVDDLSDDPLVWPSAQIPLTGDMGVAEPRRRSTLQHREALSNTQLWDSIESWRLLIADQVELKMPDATA